MSLIKKHPSIVFSAFAVIVTISGWIYVAGARAADMDVMKNDLRQLEEKVEKDKNLLIEVRADVRWIRERLK